MKIDLKNQKCQACKGDTPKFDEKQIIKYLSKLDNWSVNEEQKMIFKKLKFKNFNEALNFTNQVAHLAEEEGHHPDVSLGFWVNNNCINSERAYESSTSRDVAVRRLKRMLDKEAQLPSFA